MKAITRMVEEWVKSRSPAPGVPGVAGGSAATAAAPSLREKSILLVKLMQYVEKRFPDDLELNGHFLDIINYVYRYYGVFSIVFLHLFACVALNRMQS